MAPSAPERSQTLTVVHLRCSTPYFKVSDASMGCIGGPLGAVIAAEVELATALKVITDVSQNLALGRVTELLFETEKIIILIEKCKEDYFLCLLLKLGGNVGRGRIELKKLSAKLAQEI